MKQSFERRFSDALRARLYPNSTLRLKRVAQDTGYSEDTIARWMQGKHRVFAGAVEDIASYFARQHDDHGLLRELFGADSGLGPARAGDRVRRRVGFCFWVTDELVVAAPTDHAGAIREYLGLASAADQDFVRYAVVNLGWIAGMVQADGRLVLRYAPRALDPLVARRMIDWLRAQGRRLTAFQLVHPRPSSWSVPTPLPLADLMQRLEAHAARRVPVEVDEPHPVAGGAEVRENLSS